MSLQSGLSQRDRGSIQAIAHIAPLDAILCTERLTQRPKRVPDFETENRALAVLVEALADSPATILQKLAETLLEVFKAGSAGVSLLSHDGKSFYWPAIAGAWRPHLMGGTPRDFGPCGDVLDRNAPLLFTHWELRYPYLLEATPLAEEGLLVPFYLYGRAVGTIWAIAHDTSRQFDAEDLRQLQSFGRFASAAYQALQLHRSEREHQATKRLVQTQAQRLADASEHTRVLTRLNEIECALYNLTDRLFRARSHDEIYDAGLDAILRILHCDRASILQLDHLGIMRFVASRGLSAEYRQAVDGRSRWQPHDKHPTPRCVDDIERADGISEELKAAVRAERIAALASIPIISNDQVTGKFIAYYDTPHRFTDEEIETAGTLARQLCFGMERLRAEEARQRLATIVETSDDAIISKNLEGVILTWNAGAERIFGYTADEVIGKPVTVLMPADRVDEEPGILARLRRGERIDHYQTVRQRKDGTLIDVSLTVSPVRNNAGSVIGASKIARDISDQKRAETVLRDSEHRLQDLLSAIPAAIYTTDAEGRITYYNEAAIEFAGRRPTIGTDEWCVTWKLYWPDGTPLPHDQCPMAVALKEGRPVRGKEAVAERPDGTRIPFIPFPTPIRDSTGKVTGAINMLVDVSDRKDAESQQRLLLRELNHRVKNNMQMLQSLLFAATRQTQSEEARKVLDDAAKRITAMAAAQRVLYSTTDAARFKASEFFDAVCRTAQQTFPANVKLVWEAAAAELDNDIAMPLALILNELLTNAVKYGCIGEGPNVIRVHFTDEDESGGFVLSVEDGGPGFDLQSLKTRSSGLKLVELLARQLHGEFEVTRKPHSRCSLRFS